MVEDRLLCPPFPPPPPIPLPFPHRNAFERGPILPPLQNISSSLPLVYFPHSSLGSIRHSVGSHRLALYPQSVSDRASVRFVLVPTQGEGRKEGARLTLEKELSFETFDKLCCCDANFLVGSIYVLTKSLSFDVAGQRCCKKYRTSEFGGFFYTQDLYIYTYTCDTDGYIYTYIFVTSERQSLQSDRWKVVFFEGRKEMRRTRLSTS